MLNMKIRIAIITDIHSLGDSEKPEIRGDLAEVLLLRAVNRFNRWIKPDVVIVGGDIVNRCDDNQTACEALAKARQILDKLSCPYIAVRGNHDPAADDFYKIFERKDICDIAGYRFITFDDPEAPMFCATRTAEQLKRFNAARADFNGQIISIQHVSLFPPNASDCPYNYTNAEQIIAEMKKNKILMSVSGHFHNEMGLVQSDGLNFIGAPAVCESPFRYMVIDVDGEKVSATTDCFQLPPELGLVDRHVHTQLAYCSENMDASLVMKRYKDFGLAGVVFTEHTGQLYFEKEPFWTGDCFNAGLDGIDEKHNRMQQYFDLMKQNNVPLNSIGFEVDFDYSGRAMIRPEDKARAGFLIGSIHKLAELRKDNTDWQSVYKEFLWRTEAAVKSGINVLAHPFRLFQRAGSDVPDGIAKKIVKLLKAEKLAAEINFHSQENENKFVEMCVNSGVKLSLSSDCHNMYELGELWPHLQILKKAGVSAGDFKKILL